MSDNVVITGIGVVSPFGCGREVFWQGLMSPQTCPKASPNIKGSAKGSTRELDIANPLHYDADVYQEKDSSEHSHCYRMCESAAFEAIEDAGLNSQDNLSELGFVMGTAIGETDFVESAPEDENAEAYSFAVLAKLAERLNIGGPTITTSTACSASGYALGLAKEMIEDGSASRMLVAGVEGFSYCVQGTFDRLGALDDERCRPFDASRQGTILGDGAVVLVLESESAARERKAKIYGRVKGSGWSADAHHHVAPEPEGTWIEVAMQRAITDADIRAENISGIFPHATGTPANDVTESQMLFRVFGERANTLNISSIKARMGHSSGASCLMAVAAGALSFVGNNLPDNDYLEQVDDEVKLNFQHEKTTKAGECVAVNAYAFGGNNVSVILEKV